MEIQIHSLGTPESLDLRCILEGMYRKVGRIREVSFPDENTIRLVLDGAYKYWNEYGIHGMSRVSPRDIEPKIRTSHVMVEIDGKTREEIVASYRFQPYPLATNHITGKSTRDLMYVLSGHPLEMEMKIDKNIRILVPQGV